MATTHEGQDGQFDRLGFTYYDGTDILNDVIEFPFNFIYRNIGFIHLGVSPKGIFVIGNRLAKMTGDLSWAH